MLHRTYRPDAGTTGIQQVFAEGDPLCWLRFDVATLTDTASPLVVQDEAYETAVVILSGVVSVTVGDRTTPHVGGRGNVFEGPPATVYLPTGMSAELAAQSPRVELALCRAKAARANAEAAIIQPQDVQVLERGQKLWHRQIRNILTADVGPQAAALVLGETINDPGQWSGYPPHKHDTANPPHENIFEELYYYRTEPADGWAVQLHYGAPGFPEQGYLVRDRDSFAIPRGYHPVVAQGGYRVYYLWFMAGPSGRRPAPYEDPHSRWVNES